MSQIKTINNTRGHPQYFQSIITEKSRNFVGREFIFAAISNFINQYDKGYFTIIGEPGSGKSSLVAQYLKNNNDKNFVYYNFDVSETSLKNKEYETFLKIVNHQLKEILSSLEPKKIDNELDHNNNLFLSLLQKISDQLSQNQPLMIIIDSCHKLDLNQYKRGANLLYLPRYLPKNVYFLLTRRPFPKKKSHLLIDTPSQILDLSTCLEDSKKDIQPYLNNHPNNKEILKTLDKNETNFMYISEIIKHPNLSPETLPESLEKYYQEHWNIMNVAIEKDPEFSLKILQCLLQQNSLISLETIAEILDEDEYDIEIILEQWREFLHLETQDNIEYYKFYHPTFHHWLKQQIDSLIE